MTLVPLVAGWAWHGWPVALPDGPGERLPCVSYAPFRDGQTPFDADTTIPAAQIEDDLRRLAQHTSCVRTYAAEQGLEAVPAIAQRLGLEVLLGAWIGREADKNELQISRVIALANAYPETVRAVVVGNEVLLRREQPPDRLAALIATVREAVPVPVTYADVWEFWEEHPELAASVDFVTIHTLPYWEDEPRSIADAVPHVEAIWKRMSLLFPGKPVMIGEAGWPSAGRMREGARPGLIEQTRFVREIAAVAERNGIALNLIEAFDQPWKRTLEGTVGGHWGLFDAHTREAKVAMLGPVSADPGWVGKAAFSAALALLLLTPLLVAPPPLSWPRALVVASGATLAAVLLVEGIAQGAVGSWTAYGWAVLAVRAIAGAIAAALVLEVLCRPPSLPEQRPLALAAFTAALRARTRPAASWRSLALGGARAVVLFGAAATTLCLVFDPRYRDFATALHLVPALAFLALAIRARILRAGEAAPPPRGRPPAEELMLAVVLGAGGLAVMIGEGLLNTQAWGWAAACGLLAASVAFDPAPPTPSRRVVSASASAPSNSPAAPASGA